MKHYLLLGALFLHSFLARADSWDAPRTVDYYSADSNYFVRVVPTFIPDKYYAWRNASLKKKQRYAPADTMVVHCHATLFHREGTNKQAVVVWHQNLINRVAPMQALVSNDGRYVVTLDNWASLGYGVDVVVVYDELGLMRKRVNLEAVSPFPLNRYTRSISSLWWRCGASLTNHILELCFIDQDKQRVSKQLTLPDLTPG